MPASLPGGGRRLPLLVGKENDLAGRGSRARPGSRLGVGSQRLAQGAGSARARAVKWDDLEGASGLLELESRPVVGPHLGAAAKADEEGRGR